MKAALEVSDYPKLQELVRNSPAPAFSLAASEETVKPGPEMELDTHKWPRYHSCIGRTICPISPGGAPGLLGARSL